MIEFTLLGIPVRVRLSHWGGLALIAGLFWVRDPGDLLPVALFMLAGFIGVLAHEMGHAIIGRRLGQSTTSVTLAFLGGHTDYYQTKFSRHGKSISILAGPVTTIILGIVGWLIYVFFIGDWSLGTKFAINTALNPFWAIGNQAGMMFTNSELMFSYFLGCFMFISFWWTLLNLLPILPLDGGQFIAQYIRSPRRIHLIGVITAACVLAFSLWVGSIILTVFMIFMGIENFKAMKQAPF